MKTEHVLQSPRDHAFDEHFIAALIGNWQTVEPEVTQAARDLAQVFNGNRPTKQEVIQLLSDPATDGKVTSDLLRVLSVLPTSDDDLTRAALGLLLGNPQSYEFLDVGCPANGPDHRANFLASLARVKAERQESDKLT